MNKEVLLLIVRNALTVVGTYLIGKAVGGVDINEELFELFGGALMAIAGFYWTIKEKIVGIESLQGVMRHVVGAFAGFFIAKGVLSPEQADQWLGFGLSVCPIILSLFARRKAEDLQKREIQTSQLKTLDNDSKIT